MLTYSTPDFRIPKFFALLIAILKFCNQNISRDKQSSGKVAE